MGHRTFAQQKMGHERKKVENHWIRPLEMEVISSDIAQTPFYNSCHFSTVAVILEFDSVWYYTQF